MNQPVKLAAVFLVACKVLYYLLPMLVAWLSISLMSMHMKYHDIGINPGANNGFLLLIVAPVLMLVLYIAAFVSLRLAGWAFKSTWVGMVIGGTVVIALGLFAFWLKSTLDLDEGVDVSGNLESFLEYYLRQIGLQRLSP